MADSSQPSQLPDDSDRSVESYNPVRHERVNTGNVLPYARSRDSNHSGTVWEDALSVRSNTDDLDDTLALLGAEIESRKYPTDTTMIMEDSPEQERAISQRPAMADVVMADAQKLNPDPPAKSPCLSTDAIDLIKQRATAYCEK